MVSCIVMASGHSKRLGRDKLFVVYGGKTLLEITLERLKKTSVDEIILVYRDKKALEIAKKHSIGHVYNGNSEVGQSESIKHGIKACDTGTDGYMFTVVDQPFMKSETVDELLTKFREDTGKIVLPISGGKRGNPVIFPSNYREELLALTGDIGGKSVIEKHLDSLKYVQVEKEELFDIDIEEDLAALNRRG